MSDFYPASHSPVVNEVLSCRKEPSACLKVVAPGAGLRVLSEQPEALYNRIDQSIRNIQACPSCPIRKDLVKIILGLFRDAIALHALEARSARSFLPRDLTPAAKCPSPSRPT